MHRNSEKNELFSSRHTKYLSDLIQNSWVAQAEKAIILKHSQVCEKCHIAAKYFIFSPLSMINTFVVYFKVVVTLSTFHISIVTLYL